MELLIKGDEIGYISREDDQSFGLFCPVVQIYDDAIAAQLVDAWNSKASPASAPVAAPYYRIAERGFRWDAENRQHIPQLLIEFTPVPANAPNDSNGWKDRDKLAGMLAAAPTPPVSEDRWQPIETAPKDGIEVWCFNGEPCVMRWISGEGYALWVYVDPLCSDADPEPEQPSHWMPLPEAPAMQEDKP